ncbi:MAG: SH3 domain-containing protein [Bdellovibrionales bacterium]|nr:SH3 domain-containing protein [Bdellovibrionales bacterium]
MRWNCPHCSIELYLDDARVGNGWSFARCYSCAGFSLVRKSNVNTIRIDQAPTPETILQPQPSVPRVEVPAQGPVANALTRLGVAQKNLGEAQTSRPQVIPGRRTQPPGQTTAAAAAPAAKNIFGTRTLPQPLPLNPRTSSTPKAAAARRSRGLIPVVLGIMAVLVTGSGAFLYVQGQNMWDRARAELGPDTDGVKLGASAPQRAAGAKARKSQHKDATIFSDRIGQGAMAPNREMGPGAVVRADEETDGIPGRMVVRPIQNAVNLRMGPGTKYPIVGQADATITYTVTEWREQWFRIIPNTGPAEEAWIRNDYVNTVKETSQE